MILRFLAAIGLGSVSATLAPWIFGAIIAGVLLLEAGVWKSGYNFRDRTCDAAAKQVRIDQLNKTIAERDRQLSAVNSIQFGDALRAGIDAPQLKKDEEATNETPANNTACLDAAASARINAIGRLRR